MTFAHPWMLLGASAALIPLLVHLFDRRRPRPVAFGAISFVLRSQRRTASRLRLRRLLLYALRTLFLLAIPIALARPELRKDQVANAARGAAATVVVLDTSLSMRWTDSGNTLFEEGQREARAALRELTSEEPATVMACTASPAALMPLSFERAKVLSLVDDVSPTYELANLNRCLEAAARVLEESPLLNRRIVLISAMTQTGLALEAPPPVTAGPKGEVLKPEIVLRDVAKREELPNRAIIDVKVEPALQLGPRAWQFTFTVRNFSGEPSRDLELQLKVNGVVTTKGFLDLAPQGTSQKTFAQRLTTTGPTVVEGVLPPDALPDDDARALVLNVPRELTALLVNGAPSPQKHRDEAFFAEAALSAAGSPVRAVVRDAEAAWREDFRSYDAIFLLNVEPPPPEVAQRLKEHVVEQGRGLFISAGDRMEPEAFNKALGELLPRRLRVVKTAVEPAAPDAQARAARLQNTLSSHPVLAPFTGRAREGLLSTRFHRYMLFEGESNGEVQVLGTLDDGAPALLASRLGKGRVVAFASTLDRDWCDAPIRSGFLPLVQRIAAWLTGSLDEREQVRAHVGEDIALAGEPGVEEPNSVRSPSGKELPLRQRPDSQLFVGGPLREPGPHAVLNRAGQRISELDFAAVLSPEASDTTRHRLDVLTEWFGEDVVRSAGPEGAHTKTPWWTWLLVVGALVFFFEGVLLRK